MTLDFSDNAAFKYFADKDKYESTEINCFLRLLARNPDATVVDVGANYGPYALATTPLLNLGLVRQTIAIEPDARAFKALQDSIAKNELSGTLLVHQVIASDTRGESRLYLNARSSADNRTHEVGAAQIPLRGTRTVSAICLDDLIQLHSIDLNKPIVIKMDIQGNEPRAFAGATKFFADAKSLALFFEHAPYLIESAGLSPQEFSKNLAEVGFERAFRFKNGAVIEIAMEELANTLDGVAKERENRIQGACGDFLLTKRIDLNNVLPQHFQPLRASSICAA